MSTKLHHMSYVGSSDTDIELSLRKILWSHGLRFRKNYKNLKGKPDLVFLRKKVAVFCDGEFWHGFDWENSKKKFKSNKKFWIEKIERNMKHDEEVNTYLTNNGWRVIRFWGNELKNNLSGCVDFIKNTLKEV